MSPNNNCPASNQTNIPQPHVTIVTHKRDIFCKTWLLFVLLGATALIFLIAVNCYNGTKLFPVTIDLYAGFIPIVKQGYLQVFPFRVDIEDSIKDSIFITLPFKQAQKTKYVHILDQLLEDYPGTLKDPFRNCFLENPTSYQPCFYDRSWISKTCTRNDSYGYDINNGEYNPCLILKLENTKDWAPLHPDYESFKDPTLGLPSENFDHGFLPVVCFAEDSTNSTDLIGIKTYPPKGFSFLYFPASNFNESLYLPPLVVVKVNGVQRNANVTIDCSILTHNAFVLWNNGRVRITFSST